MEDDADIRTIAQISLAEIGGFTVQLCASGFEALQVVETFLPDLILLDMMMPRLDGIETLKKLRELPLAENIPVIFLTARVQEQELSMYNNQHILGIIKKPFDPITLPQTIRDYWAKYHG